MQRVSIDEAAAALCLSVSSVRRRIKAGTFTLREISPAGFRYGVVLPEAAPSTDSMRSYG